MKRIVALASGRGSNFGAVVRGVAEGRIRQAQVVALVVDRHHTGAEELAQQASIPVHVIDYSAFGERKDYDAALAECVAGLAPDLVLTLGYMRIMSAAFVAAYAGRLINIHPSLLPAFPGLRAQKQALDYGVRVSGCTAHYVDEGVDTGPVILQAAVAVEPDMELPTLEARILAEEHRIIVEAVDLHCRGVLRLQGRRVVHSGNS